MAFFSTSLLPSTSTSGPSSSTFNPFSVSAPSPSSSKPSKSVKSSKSANQTSSAPTSSAVPVIATEPQSNKRKRPRALDAAVTESTSPNAKSSPNKTNANTNTSGNNNGNISNAYQKRSDILSAQENLEKLMKQVGMNGEVITKGTNKGEVGSGNAKKRRRSSAPGPGAAGADDKRNGIDWEGLENDEREGNAGAESDDGGQAPKKRKVLHGLDGKPVKKRDRDAQGQGGGDVLAGLMGKKGKNKQKQKEKNGETIKSAQGEKKNSLPPPSPSSNKPAPTPTHSESTPTPTSNPAPPLIPAKPLTHLQSSMTTQLSSAKFRWLNEKLYTIPSGEAVGLMRNEGGRAFGDYHAAHRQQTSAWPSPPLPYILSSILSRLSPSASPNSLPIGALILDLGCGDAELARTLMSHKGAVERGWKVLSFDLVGDVEFVEAEGKGKDLDGEEKGLEGRKGWVVPSDFLSSIPLPGDPGGHSSPTSDPNSSEPTKAKRKRHGKKGQEGDYLPEPQGPEMVDVVVCCLSLMGINWVGGVYEACRVLKKGGTFYIAEVTSRLVDKKAFIALVSSFGLELVQHQTPTTHFDLFEFRKSSTSPQGIVKGQTGWEKRVKEGEKVMKACVYKKR